MPLNKYSLLLLMFTVPFACAASFDCGKAATSKEQAICADPGLSRLDEALNAAYARAQARVGDKALMRQWQRSWLRSLDLDGCKSQACLKKAFTERIATLDAAVPSPWSGLYQRYYQDQPDRHTADFILVAAKDGSVIGQASAVWMGPNAANGQVNVGELNAVGSFTGEHLIFETEECHVSLTRKGKLLIAEDSGNCGGHNVTFSGEYRRK